MKDFIPAGTIDRSVFIFILDGAQTDGSGKTGLAHTDMEVAWARMEDDNDVVTSAITLTNLASITAAHSDWGWEEVTACPGLYRLDLSDTVLAAGAWYAVIHVQVATSDASATPIEIVLTGSVVNKIASDTAVIEGFSSMISDISSDTDRIISDTSDVYSFLNASVAAAGILSDINSGINALQVAIPASEGDISDILSRLTSFTAAAGILSNIYSDTAAIEAIVSDIQSDTNVMVPIISDIQSDTSDIQSKLVALAAVASDIQSDTNVMVPIVSDIQSDTNVLVTKMRGVVLATGTIGATGNTTTVIHIPDAVLDSLSDDEINGYGVVIYDVSLDEYHVRTILDWTNTGDLATVSTLPFTPEASVDLYWILPPYAQQFEYDISDLMSRITLVHSETTAIQADVSDIESNIDTQGMDFSDIYSILSEIEFGVNVVQTAAALLSDINSDTNVLITTIGTAATGILSDINSGINALQAAGGALTSDQDSKLTAVTTTVLAGGTLFEMVSDVYSDTTVIEAFSSMISDISSDTDAIFTLATNAYSDTGAIHAQTTVIASDVVLIVSDTSDIYSSLNSMLAATGILSNIYSDTAAIEAAGGALSSDQDSKLTAVATTLLTGGTVFSMISDISSDTDVLFTTIGTAATGILSDINSGINAIQAAGGALTSDQDSKLTAVATTVLTGGTLFEMVSDVYSDTTIIEAFSSMISDISSDTDALVTEVGQVHSETTAIQADVSDIESNIDTFGGDFSDIYSVLSEIESGVNVVQTAAALLSDINSDTNVLITTIGTTAAGLVSDIASGVDAILAGGGALTSDQDSKLTAVATTVLVGGTLFEMASDIYSDTAVIEAVVSDINSGVDVLQTAIGTTATGLVSDIASGVDALLVSTAALPATILTTQMTEAYAANGASPTLAQAVFAIHQMLMQFGIAGTAITVKKLDNSTAAFTVTLDDATNPTSAERQ